MNAPAMQQDPVHPMNVGDGVVTESPRRTRVAADVDVLVVGGGPAGAAAAIAAGRAGARTLLIERHNMLGGMWTAGLMNPFFEAKAKGWLVAEVVDRLQKDGVWRVWKSTATFDTEAMKLLLERMATDAKVQVWYHAFAADSIVENGRVRGAIVESKSGREAVLAKVVIDCSGDGDVAARAGARYQLGRPGDGLCQPMTLMFEIDGLGAYEQGTSEQLYEQLAAAIQEHALGIELPFRKANYAPYIINVPRPGAGVVQATHVYRVNPLCKADVTRATIEARRQVHDLCRALKHVRGLEHLRLLQTAGSIGIREGRHVCGRYTLTLDDLRAGRRFDDAVTFCSFGVDIHDVSPGEQHKSAHDTRPAPYEIPYRALLPETLSNLLLAGRCISGTHEAHASYRVTGTCMGMGQAAGLAAALSAARNIPPHELDGVELRKALLDKGAGLLK